MDWYDISDDSWLATAFGDVNSDGYFDVLPEEPPLTDLYVGPPDDDLVDDTTVDDVASPAAGAQVEPFAEHVDASCWMLSDDPDARESDQYGVSVIHRRSTERVGFHRYGPNDQRRPGNS